MLEAAVAPRRPFLAYAACVALLAAGCTMCPDPYDYSGPVPNGSAPQNDFAARSNGILPTGANPRPFPPVVKAAPQPVPAAPVGEEPPAEEPKLAASEAGLLRLAAEEPMDEAEQVSADESAEIPTAASADAPVGGATPAAAVANEPAAAAPAAAETAAEPQPDSAAWRERGGEPDPEPAGAAEPALRETPGWRSRR